MIIEDVPQGDRAVNPVLRILYLAALCLLGIALILFPAKGLALGAFLLGLWLLVDGITALVRFFQSQASLKDLIGKIQFVRAILWIFLGVLFMVRPGVMSKMGLGLIFFLIGLLLLIQAILLWSVTKEETAGASLILAVIGILLMISPLISALWFIRLLGLLVLGRGAVGIYRIRLL